MQNGSPGILWLRKQWLGNVFSITANRPSYPYETFILKKKGPSYPYNTFILKKKEPSYPYDGFFF